MPPIDNALVEEYQDQEPDDTNDLENDTDIPEVEVNVRPTRNKGPPARHSDFRAYHAELTVKPQTLEEVKQRIDYPQWLEAMNTELQSLNANNTYAENGTAKGCESHSPPDGYTKSKWMKRGASISTGYALW